MTKRTDKRKDKRTRHGKADPVRIQISVTARVPKGRTLTAAVVREAVRHKALSPTHKDPKGIKIKITQWKNPTRPGKKSEWRSGNQSDAWRTLRRILASGHFEVTRGLGGAR